MPFGSTASRRSWLALAILAATLGYICIDFIGADRASLGSHDWDAMESYRLFAVTSFRRFGQFPFWDPFACGGYPYWGGPESGTILVSPVLPLYFLFSLPTAIRLETALALVVGFVGAWRFVGRYCQDPLLKATASVVAIANSRWALQ